MGYHFTDNVGILTVSQIQRRTFFIAARKNTVAFHFFNTVRIDNVRFSVDRNILRPRHALAYGIVKRDNVADFQLLFLFIGKDFYFKQIAFLETIGFIAVHGIRTHGNVGITEYARIPFFTRNDNVDR